MTAMGRLAALGFALVLVAATLLGGATGLRSAQEGTPVATPVVATSAEVRDETLVSGDVEYGGAEACHGGCRRLELHRVTLNPGAGVPEQVFSGAAIHVETGTVAFMASEGEIQISQAQDNTAASPAATPLTMMEATPSYGRAAAGMLPIGTEVLLGSGDALFHSQDATYGFRNAGETQAVVLLVFIGPPEPEPAEACHGGC